MKRQDPLAKAVRRIETEGRRHTINIYSATAIALWRYWNKREKAIAKLFGLSLSVWNECAKDYDHSMIEMCDSEIGIEITNGNGKSWHDLAYLNGSLGKKDMTYAQVLYMRQQQLTWIRPQLMACMMITLHRKWGFGHTRCARLYAQIDNIEAEFRANPERLRKECYELTGIDVARTVTTDKREKDIQRKEGRNGKV